MFRVMSWFTPRESRGAYRDFLNPRSRENHNATAVWFLSRQTGPKGVADFVKRSRAHTRRFPAFIGDDRLTESGQFRVETIDAAVRSGKRLCARQRPRTPERNSLRRDAEARKPGPAHGRLRARLQQCADGDPRQSRSPGAHPARGRARPRAGQLRRPGGRARRHLDEAHARLRAAPGFAPRGGERAAPRRLDGRDAAQLFGPGGRDRDGFPRAAVARARRSEPARARAPEPRLERARRDGRWRRADDRRARRIRCRRRGAGARLRRLCLRLGRGRRLRHGRGHAEARGRAVLHHEGRRQGHRARALDGLWAGRAIGRRDPAAQPGRIRHQGRAVAAGGGTGRGGAAAAGAVHLGARLRAAPMPCCSSTTIRWWRRARARCCTSSAIAS